MIEFWEAEPEEAQDYGIWICLIPKGEWGTALKSPSFDTKITGSGIMDHVPFYMNALSDFLLQIPEKTVISAGTSEDRRKKLYRAVLKKHGFIEFPDGLGYDEWCMVYSKPIEGGLEGWAQVLDTQLVPG